MGVTTEMFPRRLRPAIDHSARPSGRDALVRNVTMKRLSIPTLLLCALTIVCLAQPARAQVEVSVTIGGFYDELAPYGRWVDCRYGQCWVPERVASGWQPYTNGEWVYTEYGWTWMSDDPWGGNPYHYGTWSYMDQYGWSWVPGTVWAPAWVTWSYGNNYVGWAPLPPNVAFERSGYSGRAVVVNSTQYVFVPMNRFVGTNVTSVRVSAQQNAAIFRKTTPVTRFAVSGGIVRNTAIPVATIQHAAGKTIETRNISVARTTPHSMTAVTAGKSSHVAIVAHSSEVKAAVAARPQAASHSAAPSEEKGRKAEVKPEPASAKPQSRQATTVQPTPVKPKHQESAKPQSRQASATAQPTPAKPKHQEQAAPKAHVATPAESHAQAAKTPSHPQQEAPKAPAQAAKPAPPKQDSEQKSPEKKDKGEEKN
jgi:hypothetical protein